MSGLDAYDAGLLGDAGGGDISWWQDYIRAELERAHEFYSDQFAAAGTSWESIDTAPRDGTRILAFAQGSVPADTYYGVAQWSNSDPDLPGTVSGWFWSYAIRPTHWIPLPEPPK